MGYELSIKRENNKITKEEWLAYMKSDLEFEQIKDYSSVLGNGETLTVSTPDAGLWKSSNGKILFTFYEKYGEITVENPEHWNIEKMISIAEKLNAIVEGEEGEKYDKNYLKEPSIYPSEKYSSYSKKKWWEFWK